MHYNIAVARQVRFESDFFPFCCCFYVYRERKHCYLNCDFQAKSVCVSLLESPESDQQLVMVALRTLSLLLSQALLDRKEQVILIHFLWKSKKK